MYFSMGHMMFGFKIPAFFEGNHIGLAIIQMILSGIIIIINKKFFVSGFNSVIHGAPNMDTLVALGSGVSYLWSVAILFLMTRYVADNEVMKAHELMDSLYFESFSILF